MAALKFRNFLRFIIRTLLKILIILFVLAGLSLLFTYIKGETVSSDEIASGQAGEVNELKLALGDTHYAGKYTGTSSGHRPQASVARQGLVVGRP